MLYHFLKLSEYVYGRLHGGGGGGGVNSGVLTQSGRFFGRFRNFGPRSVWTLPKSWFPPYFRYGESKNQSFVAEQNGGRAVRGAEHGRFSGNLLLLAWHTDTVFTVLGPVLKHIVTMATFSALEIMQNFMPNPLVQIPPFNSTILWRKSPKTVGNVACKSQANPTHFDAT